MNTTTDIGVVTIKNNVMYLSDPYSELRYWPLQVFQGAYIRESIVQTLRHLRNPDSDRTLVINALSNSEKMLAVFGDDT